MDSDEGRCADAQEICRESSRINNLDNLIRHRDVSSEFHPFAKNHYATHRTGYIRSLLGFGGLTTVFRDKSADREFLNQPLSV